MWQLAIGGFVGPLFGTQKNLHRPAQGFPPITGIAHEIDFFPRSDFFHVSRVSGRRQFFCSIDACNTAQKEASE